MAVTTGKLPTEQDLAAAAKAFPSAIGLDDGFSDDDGHAGDADYSPDSLIHRGVGVLASSIVQEIHGGRGVMKGIAFNATVLRSAGGRSASAGGDYGVGSAHIDGSSEKPP